MRLILGCGKHTPKTEGDIFCDVRKFERVDVVHDLNVTPWPWKGGSFTHISAIHLVEHLQSLISFMDESWRVLAKGGTLYLETPEAGSDFDLTHCDPTHIRCYRTYTFHNYFSMEGIEAFGYTDKPWAILKVEAKNGIIHYHGTPLK